MRSDQFLARLSRWGTRSALVGWLVLMSTGLASAATPTWSLKTPSASPSARMYSAMAYLDGYQALLFGGYGDASYLNDTWVYSLGGNTWTLKSPTTNPAPRYGHGMAYLGGDQALIFGGYDISTNPLGDTWVYDLSDNAWTQKTTASTPAARSALALAYLSGDQALLFGGGVSGGANDTWVYDLSENTWTQMSILTKPPRRLSHALAYIGGDQVLLFGGANTSYVPTNDTWVYDLSDNTWTPKTTTGTPPARLGHTLTFIGGDRVLLFGGQDSSYNPMGDTWVYDLSDNTWTPQSISPAPSARNFAAMTYIGSEWAVLFGGANPVQVNDTWVAQGLGPTAVTLSSFQATAPTFDLAAWFAGILRRLGQRP